MACHYKGTFSVSVITVWLIQYEKIICFEKYAFITTCIYMYIVYSILYAAYSISMWNNVKDKLKSWNKVMYTNNWPENTNWLKSRLGIGYCFVWCWCLLWTAISLCQGTFIARKTNVGYGNFGFQILLSSFGFSTSNNTFWK